MFGGWDREEQSISILNKRSFEIVCEFLTANKHDK